MADTLKLEIVTPTAVAYAADVQMVTLSGADGQIGVYPQHVPLLLRIVPGEIIVRRDGGEEFLAVGGGLAAIGGDRVAGITDMAGPGEEHPETKGRGSGPGPPGGPPGKNPRRKSREGDGARA